MRSIDIRQSPVFAKFMSSLGWDADMIGQRYVYLRKFPFVGYFAKMTRPHVPLPIAQLHSYMNKHRIFTFKLSPFMKRTSKEYTKQKKYLLSHRFSVENSPFNPTTTIQIKLSKTLDEIFHSFTEAKRRAVRRAMKHGVFIKKQVDISLFISIRQKQYKPLGFLVTKEMKLLWEAFYPEHATLLIAYNPADEPIGGILLLFWDGIAYYWYASALPIGKKLFAPTLLVWEAIKTAKEKKCVLFDFEGIYDERFPKASESWKGFTKFKEGFGGEKVIFMENFTR